MFDVYYAHICFPVPNINFTHCSYSNALCLYFDYPNNYFNLYWRMFNCVYNIVTQVFYQKLRFKGKGYYVYKNYRNVLAFQFGYAHRVKIYVPFLNIKFLSKTSTLFIGYNLVDILSASRLFYEKRPINLFTGRGVRFIRQIVYRKAGKISTYR